MPGFVPIPQDASVGEVAKATNKALERFDSESVTKTFRQANGNAIVQGKLPYGGYGTLYYDSNGVPVELIGQAPIDNRVGHWIAKPGNNVITLLGG